MGVLRQFNTNSKKLTVTVNFVRIETKNSFKIVGKLSRRSFERFRRFPKIGHFKNMTGGLKICRPGPTGL